MAFAVPYEPPWNRCEICGRFIAYQEFADETATRDLLNPDAYGFDETWSTYHNRCAETETEAVLDHFLGKT